MSFYNRADRTNKFKLIVTLVVSMFFFVLALLFHNIKNLEKINVKLNKPFVLLVAGADREYDDTKYKYKVKVNNSFHGRTDTIIIVKFDPEKNKITALNLPRDTRIFINGHKAEKINVINTIGGPNLLKKILQELLNVKIDKYVIVNSEAVEKIIDALGGVKIYVPQKMKYKDMTDGIDLDLEAGMQVLNGKDAVGFLRFRKTAQADIGRIQRQQAFIRAVKERISEPSIILKVNTLIAKVFECSKTDMDFFDILKIANFGMQIRKEDMIFSTLPGEANSPIPGELFISYWVPDKIKIKESINKLFNNNINTDTNINKNPEDISINIIINKHKDEQSLHNIINKIKDNKFRIAEIQYDELNEKQSNFVMYQKANEADANTFIRTMALDQNTPVYGGNYANPMSDLVYFIY